MRYLTGRTAVNHTLRAAIVALVLGPPTALVAQTDAQIDSAMKAAYEKYKNVDSGAVADYIPELAKVNPKAIWHRHCVRQWQGPHDW